ncbi:ASKHA domain-containing protein [Bacillota bacterium LX-D]|nr:ASKHA domain-containing protein [Bacillota bacterium LX-D]
MAKVEFCNENITVQVDEGATVLEAARQAGVTIESPCNGAGVCGKCRVKVDGKSVKNILHGNGHRLSREEELEGYVLACEARIKGDVAVKTPESHKRRYLKILDHGKSFDIIMDAFIHKQYDADKGLTHVYAGEDLLGSEDGDTASESFGAVVDIGTTTLVASLVNLNSGEELDSISALNPQAVHAQDVLSRIKLASEESGLKLMYSGLIAEINRMIADLTKRNNISRERIYEVVFSGNTCMLHLASNVNPCSMGRFPYHPEITGDVHLKASEHNLAISKFGIIYLPPVISAYVGADITSGVLASQLHERKGVTLFVDVGTNGEMVLGFDGRLSATSTAAGPAFEGMNITHGMRAGTGAIEFFNIEDTGSITIKTIGEEEAIGICGSGLLDIVGELVAYGVINKNGKLIEPETEGILLALRERLLKSDGKPVFKVTDRVVLTQKDIRQVQLAKGAVRAGIEFLLKSKGIKASDVDRVLIAGSFGYHLRAKSLINIGLLPPEFEGRIEFIGNTSKSGGYAFLLNKTYRTQMAGLLKTVEVIELANYKDFDKVFVSCLNF